MTQPLRRELQYAPELAVILALCATAQAACAALDALHGAEHQPPFASREQRLAKKLCVAIANLTRSANAYRDYVAQLAAPVSTACDDLPF